MAFKTSLRTKIYLSMLAMILVSFAVTFIISVYDHNEQNDRYNNQRFFQKEEAIKASMEYFVHQQGGYMNGDSIVQHFSDKICELSDVHDVFIALFDLRGKYLISSSFVEMDSLDIPEQVNYSVLKQLSTGNQRAVIDKDFTKEQYALAYWYFYDASGKPILITNVVYEKSYDRLTDLKNFLREISQSYIVLFLLAAVVAYLLSRYITKSLQTITKKIRNVSLAKHNEPIEWRGSDEIGALVMEYNRMLGELENSALKLAQTERESAWREMAQQVAHEIKNPLTPMKLRMQQLVKSWDDGDQTFDKRIHLFSQSMIEQIDALTRIANEFSNFAKMPKPMLESLNIVQLTKNVVELYREKEGVDFTLRFVAITNEKLMLDKDQTIRVLNNLITNAIQAIPSDKNGKVDICVRGTRSGIIIRISDNGTGISPEQKSKIFVPSFTTKSTGTGLGLAMVKNIVTQSGGDVFFWSKKDKGASFYVVFNQPSQ
jgi:two-component system nitrogen regulation sensor histidine kinase NtrY